MAALIGLGLGSSIGRRLIALRLHAQQLLVAAAFGEPREVSANRGAHVLEVTLLAHGGVIPAGRAESFR